MIFESLVLAGSLYNLGEAKSNREIAERISLKAASKFAQVKDAVRQQQVHTDNALLMLANRRKAMYSTSFDYFVKVMEPLKKSKILSSSESETLEYLRDKLKDYSLFVQKYNTGKTTSIKSVELDNCLFFLLGASIGMVGAIGLGLSYKNMKDSESLLSSARVYKKNAEAFENHSQTVLSYLEYIEKQCKIMSELSARLNLLLIKVLKQFEQIVLINGSNKLNYSLENREMMRFCFNLVDVIKKITDVAIFSGDEISSQFSLAIEYGQNQLNHFNVMIENQQYNLLQYK